MNAPTQDHLAVLAALGVRGVVTSAQLQAALTKSQPTLSRLLADLSSQVVTLGRGRNTRYALAKPIMGRAAQQPLWWIDEAGTAQRIGTLSLLGGGAGAPGGTGGGNSGGDGNLVHVAGAGFEDTLRNRLPWYLTPLKPQGFLGRLLAQRLAAFGLAANPDSWGIEAQLFAALQLHDAPGAMALGEPAAQTGPTVVPADAKQAAVALDALAQDVGRTGRAGSSAGGEQPKFLAMLESGDHVLVKFTPPRGTPFGERWHDLLHAEALAASVLASHGVAVAASRVVETRLRTYLLATRFDRVGAAGRRHAVAVGALHDAFVPGGYSNWANTCEALAQQGRLSPAVGVQARALLDFGRLIGNTDMHSGNLSLFADISTLAGAVPGGLSLAPVYDMLPMCWRPDPLAGGGGGLASAADANDYTAFEPDPISAAGPARMPAAAFWSQLAQHARVSKGLRQVAADMARRLPS